MHIAQKILVLVLVLTSLQLQAQRKNRESSDQLLQSGPMVGYSEMMEVMLWAQTKGPAQVHFVYINQDDKSDRHQTETYLTQKTEGYTAHLVADEVEPGQKYTYKLFINDREVKRPYPCEFQSQELWQWRTDPPNFRIALGSCVFVNETKYDRPTKMGKPPYGGGYEIFEQLHAAKPDMMLWLGDNTYLREVDWHSKTGIYHRYTHTRSLPEMQAFLASTHHYAIWDDHDYGPNNSDRRFRDKEIATQAFKDFWGNQSYGVDGQGGITSRFIWADMEFFVLDNRYFRTPNDMKTGEKILLGQAQIDWLIESLISSPAPFKFVCVGGQVLNDVAKYENHINLAPKEREQILNRIGDEKIKNVIFLTGDRHHSELSETTTKGIKVYDLTVSPLTSGAYNAEAEPNGLRVKGSQIGERNYGIIDVSGPRKARKLTISLHDVKGKKLWDTELKVEK